MRLRLLAVGAISLLGQVVLLRELEVAFFGTELVLVLGLGAWLLGTAAGAASGRGAAPPGDRAVRALFVAAGVALPLAVVLARGVRVVFGGVPGAYLPFGRQLLALALCLVPVSFLLGLLFSWTAQRFIASGRSPAAAYAIESAGGLLGGLLATLLLMAGVSDWGAVLLCAVAALAIAWSGPRLSREAAAGGLFLALVLLVAAAPLDRAMTAWDHPDLLATRDTPYGRVTVTGTLGQVVVFENDALSYESQGTAAEEFVQLAAIQRGAPRRVLVLGGAAQGLIPEVLEHGPERVDDVELDRALLALVAPRLPEAARAALADPRVRVVFADPRRFLARAGRYDLILSGMPEPESGRTNRYYTREFFAACAARLAPGGVLALRLRSAENLWTPVLARRAAGVRRALRAVFPSAVVLPGTTNLFLASGASLVLDPAVLGARLAARGVKARLVSPAYVRYLYTNDRFAEIAALLARTPAQVNRDARPACYQATMLLWLARFFPPLARLDLPEPGGRALARSPWTWAGVVGVLLLCALGRRRVTLRRALLAGAAGLAGMLLETVLLLQYQTRSGVLFQDLGVLLTAFMAGLALGAWALERWLGSAARGGSSAAAPTHGALAAGPGGARHAKSATAAGVATLLGLAALGVGCALLLRDGAVGGLAPSAALLFAGGLLVAAAFACAVLRGTPDARAILGPVYAADLLGGGAGSLLAGLVTIPMLGLPATAALAALVAIAALALV
jgi:spermidine synthase